MRDVTRLDPKTRTALNGFRALLIRRYGERLRGVVLFGSRARGDHRPDSDADVAVFIDDSDDPIRDQMDMAGEAYHQVSREKPRPSGRGGIACARKGASLCVSHRPMLKCET